MDLLAELRARKMLAIIRADGADRALECIHTLVDAGITAPEVVAALDLGATAVKIFPAKVYGPGYLRELLAPLPGTPLIAVGGVDAKTAPEYLAAGALAVGVSSPLLGDAGSGGSQSDLAARAKTFLAAIKE